MFMGWALWCSENKEGFFLSFLGSLPTTLRDLSVLFLQDQMLPGSASFSFSLELLYLMVKKIPQIPLLALDLTALSTRWGTLGTWCEQRVTLGVPGMVLNVFCSADLESFLFKCLREYHCWTQCTCWLLTNKSLSLNYFRS